MQTPIITTKLYTPNPPLGAVQRSRLLAKLNRGLQGKLTLFAAPAGFGKSTLMSQWMRAVGRPLAWLTLDEQDNDPPRFLAYVVAALRGFEAAFGAQTLALPCSPQPPPLETVLTTLLNELARTPAWLSLAVTEPLTGMEEIIRVLRQDQVRPRFRQQTTSLEDVFVHHLGALDETFEQ
jgi:ATP/maltotriose-dependent transcriptional regulator MalT